MGKVKMTLAAGDYDRVRPLWDGGVQAEGLDLNVIRLPIEEIFFRMARYREFDACEFSFSSYLIAKSRGFPEFQAIPVFPSRKFRHADIYVRAGSKVQKPEDLQGGRIGVPEYQITAAVWLRGILEEFHGVKAADVHWFTGGTEVPGREERLKLELPPPFKKTAIPKDRTLFDMLKMGELDAVFTARVPTPFLRGEDWIDRLFPDFKAAEIEYYQKTGIFPIMHLVALRGDVYEKYPWAAQSLFKAFSQAKEMCMDRLLNLAALPVMLPWFSNELESAFKVMGRDFWPYGLAPNRKAIETIPEYMRRQGLLPDDFRPTPEELFALNTLAEFGV